MGSSTNTADAAAGTTAGDTNTASAATGGTAATAGADGAAAGVTDAAADGAAANAIIGATAATIANTTNLEMLTLIRDISSIKKYSKLVSINNIRFNNFIAN